MSKVQESAENNEHSIVHMLSYLLQPLHKDSSLTEF